MILHERDKFVPDGLQVWGFIENLFASANANAEAAAIIRHEQEQQQQQQREMLQQQEPRFANT